MINLRRLKAVARKEFLHVLRDWRSLVLAIFIPVALILLFGYALNMDLNNTPTLVWDQSRTPQSREFVSLLEGSPYFRLLRYVDSYREIEAALDRGEAMLGLAIPGDFAARTLSGREAVVQALIDGSDSTRARLAMAYIEGIGRLYDRNLFVRHLERKGRRPPEALQ